MTTPTPASPMASDSDRPICDGCKEYEDQCDCGRQSTFARVLASEPKPGGIGDLHAEIAVLKSSLASAESDRDALRAELGAMAELEEFCREKHEYRIGRFFVSKRSTAQKFYVKIFGNLAGGRVERTGDVLHVAIRQALAAARSPETVKGPNELAIQTR